MINEEDRPELEQSEIVEALPKACSDELAAVEFIEAQRWGDKPKCPHCESENVYKMTDRDGTRNKRFLWRCRGCGEQYTVRIGTIYEDSRLPLRHWCYAFWRAATSKKGVSALEISRQCQITYKSALFLMHRIRFAMAPTAEEPKKTMGQGGKTVECDETYVGGKPRKGTGKHKRGRGTKKSQVFAIVERGGNIRRMVTADVVGKNLKQMIRENVHQSARIVTDEFAAYHKIGPYFEKGLHTVNHKQGEYARGSIHTNTAESSFAILKRGITGIYHAVSKKHLHRYVSEFDFRWNARKLNDGERTALLVKAADGKRLHYQEPVAIR